MTMYQAKADDLYRDCVMDECDAPDADTACRMMDAFMERVRKEVLLKTFTQKVDLTWRTKVGCMEGQYIIMRL